MNNRHWLGINKGFRTAVIALGSLLLDSIQDDKKQRTQESLPIFDTPYVCANDCNYVFLIIRIVFLKDRNTHLL